jgi:HAE1 family hydrophobic/amphiphilic exporter-1
VLKQSVDLGAVYQTLQAFMGGVFVNYFNRFGRVWQVYVQADGEYRTRADNIGQFYVRNTQGDAVPMSSVVSIEPTHGPEFTMRFNGFRSAQINASAVPGVSSAQVMAAMEQVFAETMPSQMGFDYSGMSFQEKVAAQGVPASVIFGLSLLFVFLILAAQYESWTLPFSVLLGTPIAVFGAFLALWLLRLENNVFAQIGLVTLIGLAAKNAILIVEFAKEEVEKGKPLVEATLTGARLRLRPILMTAFAFILGVVPLVRATGAGAIGRRIIGSAVMGGMLMASLVAIFLIPVSFYVVEKLGGRREDGAPPEVEAPTPAAAEGGQH